ncbi:MAG: hypothetical protein Q9226_008835, partial [Calogaya cf. arnoldii]
SECTFEVIRYSSDEPDALKPNFTRHKEGRLLFTPGKPKYPFRFDRDPIHTIRWCGGRLEGEVGIEIQWILEGQDRRLVIDMANDVNVQKLLEKLTGKSKETFGEVPVCEDWGEVYKKP